jgi:hypothetical protein
MLVFVLIGALTLSIGGVNVRTAPQTIVLMPANVPHAVHAAEPCGSRSGSVDREDRHRLGAALNAAQL